MDDFDVYEGLDEFIEQSQEPSTEVIELSEKLKNISDQLTQAHRKNENLININKTLKYNISTVLLTARRELTRKDERITSLVKEKDEIIFRRGGSKFKPEGLPNKSELVNINNKQMCDNCLQTITKNGKMSSDFSGQKRNAFVQTDSINEKSSEKTLSNVDQSSQTDLTYRPYLQTVRYVGDSSVFKIEHVEILDFIEKSHRSVQTVKTTENLVSNKSINNSKSTEDDSDVIESLLALSRGSPNNNQSNKLVNDDYEKLLLDRQTILDELSKTEPNNIAKPIKKSVKLLKKVDRNKFAKPKVEEVTTNLDIYELSPVYQMDKTKPIRQYGGGKGKLSKILPLVEDTNKSVCNNSQKEEQTIMDVDNQQNEEVKKLEIVVKPSLPVDDIVKKPEPENIKHSRKQTFTDIRTNCNLEHIPTEPFLAKKVNASKPKPKISRTRKRRLDTLFDEPEEGVKKKTLRSQTPVVNETVEKCSTHQITEKIENVSETVSSCNETDNLTIIASPEVPPTPKSLTEPKESTEPQFPPLPPTMPEELPPLPPTNIIQNQEISAEPHTNPPLPAAELPSENNNIANKNSEMLSNETEVLSVQDDGEQSSQNLNSSVEIKMSSTSYKIETHGDETTVYIRRNKKKKKNVS